MFLKKGNVQKRFDVERVQELNGDILLKLRNLDSPEAACDADADGKKRIVLVPFLDQFIGQVDTKNKTIELKETWFFE